MWLLDSSWFNNHILLLLLLGLHIDLVDTRHKSLPIKLIVKDNKVILRNIFCFDIFSVFCVFLANCFFVLIFERRRKQVPLLNLDTRLTKGIQGIQSRLTNLENWWKVRKRNPHPQTQAQSQSKQELPFLYIYPDQIYIFFKNYN